MAEKYEITFINNILKNNELLRNNEYELLGIIKENFIIKKKKISEYQLNQPIKEHQQMMNQYSYQLNKKKEIKLIDTSNLNNNDIDIINDGNVFNLMEDNTNYNDWKSLTIDEQKEKLKNYLDLNKNNYYLDDDLTNKLNKLIDDKKIYYKKYIEYDKVNERIIKLPLLVNNLKLKKTEIILTDSKKIKKSNKFFSN